MKRVVPVSTRLWTLAVVTAGLFVGWALLWPPPRYSSEVTDPPVQAQYPEPLAINAMAPNPADPAWTKPLFFNDRSPRVAALDGEAGGADAATGFVATLTGIARSPGVILVTLTGTEGGKPLLVRLGDEVDGQPGWRLVRVGARQAVFRNGDQEHVLEIVARDARNHPPPPGNAHAAATAAMNPRPPPTPGITGQSTHAQADAASAATDAANADSAATAADPAQATLEPEQRQQVEAIRRRIEERRKQLRQSNPSPNPTP